MKELNKELIEELGCIRFSAEKDNDHYCSFDLETGEVNMEMRSEMLIPVGFNIDFHDEGDSKIGYISGIILPDDEDFFDAADSHSADAACIAEAVIDEYDREQVKERYKLHDNIFGSHMIIETINIDKKYRGQGLGERLIIPAIKFFVDEYFAFEDDLLSVLLYAAPYELREKGLTEEDDEFRAAQKKLINFYRRIGFKTVKQSPIMYLSKY